MTELPYYTLPDPPTEMTATGVLIRLVDSFGFRYRWATEGLREEDMELTSRQLGGLLKGKLPRGEWAP